MVILGIDTGSEETGWLLFDTEKYSVIDKGKYNNELFIDKIRELEFDVAAVEMVASYGFAVGQTVFQTCLWIGRFVQQIISIGKPYELLYKKVDINPIICGSNKAKDTNIRQALIDMFPADGGGKTPQVGTKNKPGSLYGVSKDIWAALAVAITYSLKNKIIKRKIF